MWAFKLKKTRRNLVIFMFGQIIVVMVGQSLQLNANSYNIAIFNLNSSCNMWSGGKYLSKFKGEMNEEHGLGIYIFVTTLPTSFASKFNPTNKVLVH